MTQAVLAEQILRRMIEREAESNIDEESDRDGESRDSDKKRDKKIQRNT